MIRYCAFAIPPRPEGRGFLGLTDEWLELPPEVKSKIQGLAKKSRTPVHLRGLMEQVLLDHGHPFHTDAVRLLNQGVLPKSVVEQMRLEHKHRLVAHKYM